MNGIEEIRPYIEFAAVATGSISGALHAQSKSFDFVGIVVIGVISGLGGGLIRDMMLGAGPALALQSRYFLIVAVIASLLGVLFGRFAGRLGVFMWIIDSLSLGLFSVAGLKRAEFFNLSVVSSIFLGTVTCVGGGLIRDILCRDIPKILLPGRPYSIVAILAGTVYIISLREFGLAPRSAEMLAVSAAFVFRLLASWREWETPVPHK